MANTHKKPVEARSRMPTQQHLLSRIERLEREVHSLKRQIDPDAVLDAEDRKAIAASRKDAREGRLISHEEMLRRLECRRCDP